MPNCLCNLVAITCIPNNNLPPVGLGDSCDAVDRVADQRDVDPVEGSRVLPRVMCTIVRIGMDIVL
jgi:hypothetical protein